jgi:hypothetical protein
VNISMKSYAKLIYQKRLTGIPFLQEIFVVKCLGTGTDVEKFGDKAILEV